MQTSSRKLYVLLTGRRVFGELSLRRVHVFMPSNVTTVSRSVVILQDRLRIGGTEKQSVWMAEALRQRAWDCRLRLLLPEHVEQNERGVLAGASGRLAILWSFLRLLKDLRASPPDVMICMGRVANCLGFLAKWAVPSLRLVATCRTNRKLPFFYRRSLRQSELCIANSKWSANEVAQAAGVPQERIIHIENALLRADLLDLDVSAAAKTTARRELGLAADVPVLCNISSFVPGKNKQDLLLAFARCKMSPDAMLLLAGDGGERAVCEGLARELGVSSRVRFLGNTDAIAPILQASDLFVSTSLRDSLPNALIEAQAAGLPVVAYDVAGAGEAFDSERSGLAVPAGDVDALALAIERLISSPELRCDFGVHGRERARELYSPEMIGVRYDAALGQLFGG